LSLINLIWLREKITDSLANLRRKIGSAGELLSVVLTMKAIAAAGVSDYESSVVPLADYYFLKVFSDSLSRHSSTSRAQALLIDSFLHSVSRWTRYPRLSSDKELAVVPVEF